MKPRRTLALILASVMMLSALPAALAEAGPGDLTCDGKVNAKDIVLLSRYLAGGYGVTLDENAADLNGDGKRNAKDTVLLQRFLAGGYSLERTPPPAVLSLEQQAVIAYAEAMLARGVRVQYDDSRLIPAAAAKEYRWQQEVMPAEAYTSQYTGYTNCSAFAHDVYYFGLGFETAYWSASRLENADEPDRVLYYKLTGKETEADKARLKAEFLAALQPGDIIVYRKADESNGHAMFYAGNGRIIHSEAPGGGSYNYTDRVEKREANGSIGELDVSRLFEEGFSRNLLGGNIGRYAIGRPLKTWTGTVPQEALDRMANLRGVTAEKLCSKTIGQFIAPGEELTYTFRLENTNDEPVTLEVRDTLDGNVTFVSGCDDVDGSALVWTVTVPAGETEEIAYTVRVKDDAKLGIRILADKGTVGGVSCRCPTVYTGNHLSDGEKAAIAQAAQAVESDKTGWALAAELYDGATQVDLTAVFPSPQTVFAALFPKSSTTGHFYISSGTSYYFAVAPTMYGGRVVKKSTNFSGVRTRGLRADQLEIGDILVCTDNVADEPADSDYDMWMIAGEDAVLSLKGAASELLTGAAAQAALDRAISYQKFAVLCPAAMVR